MEKHAFLIAAHNDPEHLKALVTSLDLDGTQFFIHIDNKIDIRPFIEIDFPANVSLIDKRVEVYWGGWSQVQATINLIDAARSSGRKFERYTLMSGSHYPIRPIEAYRRHLAQNNLEYINITAVPNPSLNKGLDRFVHIYFEGAHRSTGVKAILLRAAYHAARLVPLRHPTAALKGWRLYAGSSWWTLTGRAVEHISSTIENSPHIVEFFRYVKMPDESFFQTILGNSDFLARCRRADVYTDWSNPKDAPCFIRDEHLATILDDSFRMSDGYGEGPAFFARKFGVRNAGIVAKIRDRNKGDSA